MTAPSESSPLRALAATTPDARKRLTRDERDRIGAFLNTITYAGAAPLNGHGYHGISREQYSESYQSWWRGGRAWHRLEQGGTGQMAALCWYQHIHKPGSKEWRPSIIIRAVLAAATPEVPRG